MGWFKTFLKMLVTDDSQPQASKGQLARGRIDGRQIVRVGSFVRLTEGEWKGEDAVVEAARPNGELTVTVQRNGRSIRTWEHKVQALRGATKANQTAARTGMKCRINRGDWRGRVGVITDVNTSGVVWVRITGGNESGHDSNADTGKEVRCNSNDLTLLGR